MLEIACAAQCNLDLRGRLHGGMLSIRTVFLETANIYPFIRILEIDYDFKRRPRSRERNSDQGLFAWKRGGVDYFCQAEMTGLAPRYS
jgi:hypothetical protein